MTRPDAAAAATVRRLEVLGLNSSRPPEEEFHDGWLLRFSPGKAKRARCVNPLAAGSLPVAAKIAHCERRFAEEGLPALFRLTPLSLPDGLGEALLARGYREFDHTCVDTLDLAAVPRPVADPRVEVVALAPWADAVGRLRGSGARQVAVHLERLQALSLDCRPVWVQEGGMVQATGLAIVEEEAVGLFDIVVHPDRRRGGLARAIVASLLSAAAAQGARLAYLQVDAQNAAARSLYVQFGFATAYRYRYLAREGEMH